MAWLNEIPFTELDLESLRVDPAGGIYVACNFKVQEAAAVTQEPVTSAAAVAVSPFPSGLIFHSRPGSANVLYLNFGGESVSNTQWNVTYGQTVFNAIPFDTDGNASSYSDGEQLAIKRIWQRVAEDYAPFDIDVTTERPASFNTRTAHALITRSTDANNIPNPESGAGGVAYINVFNTASYASYRPAWIYLQGDESYMAEAASHEIGHNMGLNHDGTTSLEYYGGHGSGDTSWGPIMGTGYHRDVSQWSKGEYYAANNTQDDLSVLAGKMSYRTDDVGGTSGSASALVLSGGTNIVSTTPENDPANVNTANKGVIERNTDVDVYSFVTGSGAVSLTVMPWAMPSAYTLGGNLDVLLQLYDDSGTLLMTNNPTSTTSASIQTNLPQGRYYLYVRNTGAGNPLVNPPSGYTSYGSIGQYFISGYVKDPSGVVLPPTALADLSNITSTGLGSKEFTVTYTDDLGVNVATIDSNDIRVTGPNGYDQQAQFLSLDVSGNGSPRTATYSLPPPDLMAWRPQDNGTYTVTLRSNQVADVEGAYAAAGVLGQFDVTVPVTIYAADMDSDPGWTFEGLWEYGTPGYSFGTAPLAGYTGTNILGYNLSGYYENGLPYKYATTPAINATGSTSLTLRFRRWLRTRINDAVKIEASSDGANWLSVWSTSSSIRDGAWEAVEYDLPSAVVGSSTLKIRWGISSGANQNDVGWNLDDVEVLAGGMNVVIPPSTVQLYLTAAPTNWGSVTPPSGGYTLGTNLQLTATPAPYYQFEGWAGDRTGTNNPLSVQMQSDLTIQAVFTERLTTNYPTPYWWLAENGYTNNFESAVSQLGANGMPLWQSYIAGLDPADPSSQLLLRGTAIQGGGGFVLNWNTVTARTYSVWSSTNAGAGFELLPQATDLPWTVQGITNVLTPSSPGVLFRLEVKKP